jgi:4-amino-4-deoxy-L-arabinose transferase-like glycosyltransferase
VHPWWESAWFFSKPAFTMWMQALGLQLADAGPVFSLLLGALAAGVGYWLFTMKGPKDKSVSMEFWGLVLVSVGSLVAALSLWGLSLKLPYKFAHVTEGDGALPLFTEWGFRAPFTGFSILAVGLLAYAMTRTVSARAALATTFVLCTMPLYFLLSRQAVTDPPLVSATISGIACGMVALLDKETKRRDEWWYASYTFIAMATLAKEWLGFLIPAGVFVGYWVLCVMPFDGKSLAAHLKWAGKHALQPLGVGLAAAVVVGLIAYKIGLSRGTMFMSGPPATSGEMPGQGHDVIGPAGWLGITWGGLAAWIATTVSLHPALKQLKERPPVFFESAMNMRLGTGILLFIALSFPWYYEMFTFPRVDDESKLFWFRFVVHDQLSRFFSGVHTTTPGGTFTYFIEQGGYAIWPWVLLVPGAMAVVARFRVRGGTTADAVGVIAVLWMIASWYVVGDSATKFHHYVFPILPSMAILIGIFIDKLWEEGVEAHLVALIIGVPLFLLVGHDLWTNPKNFTDLFVYNYDRPYPDFLTQRVVVGSLTTRDVMKLCALLGLGLGVIFALQREKTRMFATGLTGALIFALWFNWSHWVDLSHHWTQRDQFWRYFTQRQSRGEPIAAFLMNWRGETFYSRNTVKQIKDNANVGMFNYAALPGRKWSLVEHNRLGILKGAVGQGHTVTLIDKDLNNKFVLVTID